jgi:hypothetical protein
MTADIVNLRTARKQKARAAREVEAANQRAKSGRTKAEKTTTARNTELAARRLDQARRTPADDDDKP